MATKPKEVPCEEVIDCIDELHFWLVSRNLAKRNVGALKASFDVLYRYPDESRVENVVARCIHELDEFLVAEQRRAKALQAPHLQHLNDEDKSLLFDAGPEVETDKAIRAFEPKLAHLKRLLEQVAMRKVLRTKLKGFDDAVVSATRTETRVFAECAFEQLELAQRKLAIVLEAFQTMCPALPEDELTLSGWRRLERSVRKRLRAAGYEAATPERAR